MHGCVGVSNPPLRYGWLDGVGVNPVQPGVLVELSTSQPIYLNWSSSVEPDRAPTDVWP